MKPIWPTLVFPHIPLPSQLGLPTDLSQIPLVPSNGPGTAFGAGGDGGIDVAWYPPAQTPFNDLDWVLHGPGLNGLVFQDEESLAGAGQYNWCNMPRVRAGDYVHPGDGFEIVHAEVVGCQNAKFDIRS